MEITLQDILHRIEQADDPEINEIISAVRRRFACAFPEWEVLFISCPRHDPIQRQQVMARILDHFRNV